MKSYRGVKLYSEDCPKGCFHRMIDNIIAENIVAGTEPKVDKYPGFGRVVFEARRYSKALKRHSSRPNGNYNYAYWTHCPLCGSKLEE